MVTGPLGPVAESSSFGWAKLVEDLSRFGSETRWPSNYPPSRRDLCVVIAKPLFRVNTNLTKCPEDVHVQPAASLDAVEAVDKAVLHRPSRLDEVQGNAHTLNLFAWHQYDELRAAV